MTGLHSTLGCWKERLSPLEIRHFMARPLEGLSLSRVGDRVLGNFRLLRRADPPAKTEDESASDPGGDQQSSGRGAQQLEPSFRDGRCTYQRDQAGAVDHAVNRGG